VRPAVADLAHGEGSAEWLARRGHAELGPVIVGHPVMLLADGAWFETVAGGRLAGSADRLVRRQARRAELESMTERFASWERRYPTGIRPTMVRGSWPPETMAAVRARAEVLEARVCALAGVAPADLRRLAWTGRALRLARGG